MEQKPPIVEEKVPQLTDAEIRAQMKAEGGQGGGLKEYAKILLPALLVLVFVIYQSGNYVKVADDKINSQGTAAEITALKSSISSLNALSTQITQLNSNIATINSKLASLEVSDRSFVTSDKLTALQGAITSLQSEVASVRANTPNVTDIMNKLNALQSSLDTLKTEVANHWTAVAILQDNVTALQNRLPAGGGASGSNTVGGSSSTLNNLTATIYAPMSFGSNLPITSVSVSGNTSTSNWFQLQLNNATGKTLNNIQLAIGLALVDINGNPIQNSPVILQPSSSSTNGSVTIALTTSGGGASWAYQSMMPPNIVVFSNSSSSSYFGFGTLAMSTSTMTLTIYINITSYNVTQQALNFYPIIKVLGYN